MSNDELKNLRFFDKTSLLDGRYSVTKKPNEYILILGQDSATYSFFSDLFSKYFNIIFSNSIKDAIRHLDKNNKVSVAVLDLNSFVEDVNYFKEFFDSAKEHLVSVSVIAKEDIVRGNADFMKLGATDIIRPPLIKQIVLCSINNLSFIHEVISANDDSINYASVLEQQKEFSRLIEHDDLTGLLNRKGFYSYMTYILESNKGKKRYLVGLLDVDDFKVVNYLKGVKVGDELLKDIADCLLTFSQGETAIFSRFENDHFYFFIELDTIQPELALKATQDWITSNSLFLTSGLRMGIYYINNAETIDVFRDCQKALFALQTIKGSFSNRIAYYNDRIYDKVISEQQLTSEMVNALTKKQFEVYYQPQYNYDTNKVCGAEALVRWNHPTMGLLMPGKFIPLFERNGFIIKLDQFVWESVCEQLSKWVSEYGEDNVPPVSVNISRFDIYHFKVVDFLKELVLKYRLPIKLLRVEITESSYMVEPERLLGIVKKLMDFGFLVEMDDFGSAYSSLNMLKDIPVNVLKLDLKFLSGSDEHGRSGIILTNIIRMAHWLSLPIIAEGVESKNQADYLKSIGVILMQGFYFSKPIQVKEYETVFKKCNVTHQLRAFEHSNINDVEQFLDASNQTAIVFNTYVGGAIIIQRFGKRLEILRANDTFYKNLGTSRDEYEEFLKDFSVCFDEKNNKAYNKMLDYAMSHGESYAFEIFDGFEKKKVKNYWTRNRARFLGKIAGGEFFYVAVENITNEKEAMNESVKQKEGFAKLYNGVQCGIIDYVVDKNQDINVYRYNDTAWRLFGFSNVEAFEEEIFGERGLHFIHPESYEEVRAALLDVNKNGHEKTIECRRKMTDGSYRWHELRIYKTQFEEVDAVEVIFIDINDRQLSYNWKGLRVLFSIFKDLDIYNFATNTIQRISENYAYNDKLVMVDSMDDRFKAWAEETFVYDQDLKDKVINNFTLEGLNKLCKGSGSYQFEFKKHDNNDDVAHYYRTTISRIDEHTFISCTLDITKQHELTEINNRNIALQATIEEQEKYRIVIEQADIAVFEMDYTKNLFTASDNYKRYAMSVDTPDKILSNTGNLSFVHPDDLEILFRFFKESENAKITDSEALLRLKMMDGSFNWTRMRAKYIRDKKGNNIKTIGTFIDVNDDVVSKKEIVSYQNELEMILQNVPSGIIVMDIDENLVATPLYINKRANEIFGYSDEDRKKAINHKITIENLFSGRLKYHEYMENIVSNRDFIIPDASIKRKNGEVIRAKCILKHVFNHGRVIWYVIVMQDNKYIVGRKNKVDVDEVYSLLAYSIKAIIVDYSFINDEIAFHYVNDKKERVERKVLNFTKYLYSKDCFILEKYRNGLIEKLRNALSHEIYETYEFEGFAMDKKLHWYRFRFSSIAGDNNNIYRIVGCLDNFDDVMNEQQREVRKAMIDEITLLSNKDLGRQLMVEAMNNKMPNTIDAMIFFDIDYFKRINDTYGHLDADLVLGYVGKAIHKVFGKQVIASRFGGDEFLIYLKGIKERNDTTLMIKKLYKEIEKIKLRDGSRISISLGCKIIKENYPVYEDVFRNADMALYASKQHGKNQFHYYEDVDIKTIIK